METFDIALAVAAVALVALATAWRDLGERPRFVLASLGFLAVYMVYCLIAVAVVFQVLGGEPAGEARAAAGTVFVIAWIGWGVLWLIRYAPKNRQPPAVLTRPFGWLGIGFLILGAAGFAALVANM